MSSLRAFDVMWSLFMIATALSFCLQIANVSSTDSSGDLLSAQTDQGNQGKIANQPRSSNSSSQSESVVNPEESWNFFQNQGKKTTKAKGKKHGKGSSQSQCPPSSGPPGPPGPPGPQGPPGAQVTEATMMAEFRSMMQESANRRSRRIADQNISLMAAGIPDLLSAYHVLLRNDIHIPKKSHQELNSFKQPGDHSGAFIRGSDIDVRSGRYVIRYSGVYHFTANLVISRVREANLRPRDYVKISICISSLCELNTSLSAITGMESNSLRFTVSVSGMLMLKANTYVSIYVENNTSKPVLILEKSSFSGIMIGR